MRSTPRPKSRSRYESRKSSTTYLLSQHFQVFGFKSPQYQVAQPWVKGWNGESFLQDQGDVQVFARLWLDRDLKAEMGF